jgi:hypothetical protein
MIGTEQLLRSGNPLLCNQMLVAYVRDEVIVRYLTQQVAFVAHIVRPISDLITKQNLGKSARKQWPSTAQCRPNSIPGGEATCINRLWLKANICALRPCVRTFSLFGSELQNALQRLACLPSRGVKIELLAKVLKRSPDLTRQSLKTAIDSGIIRIIKDEVVFSHDRHHLAVIASIRQLDKVGLHLSVADALEGLSSPELNFVRADLLLSAYTLDPNCVALRTLCRACESKHHPIQHPAIAKLAFLARSVLLATQFAIRGLASDLAQRYLDHARSIWRLDSGTIWQTDPETMVLLVEAVSEVAIAKRMATEVMQDVSRCTVLDLR